jgi:ABC-2 type transport system permease protein
MNAIFQTLSVDIVMERKNLELKRLSMMPLSKVAYFAGKLITVSILTLVQIVTLLIISALLFHLRLHFTPEKVIIAIALFILGTIAFSSLGVMCGFSIRNSDSAVAFIVLPTFVLNFFSGVFIPISVLPGWLQTAASIFPLKWLAQGMRYLLLSDKAIAVEGGADRNIGQVLLVLLVWTSIGFFAALKTFNMKREDKSR